MTVNLFDQFATPDILGLPLIMLAMLLPVCLLPQNSRLIQNRTTTVKMKLMRAIIKSLFIQVNKPGHAWIMLLLTTMFFLTTTNLLGLLPYTFTPTTQLSLNLALALPLWLTTVLMGLHTQPTITLAHLLPLGTPMPLIPILIIIETMSLFIRPLALGVRLTANLTAGHLLITLISITSVTMLSHLPTIVMLTTTLLILLTGLELAVAMIQAYVFVLLLSLYLQENT